MGWLATIIVGLIAGFLASLIMKARGGLLVDLLLGIVGGFVGGWLTGLVLHKNMMTGINIQSILVALVGAIIVLFVYRLIFRRR
jgi:uncharacterized membrane protein YeaQ/YmgE (transglycosylase-associated protein family)